MPIFTQFGSIKGWATETNHVGWIPLESVMLGPTGAQGKNFTSMDCLHNQDGSSTDLWKAASRSDPVTAVIEFARTGKPAYLKMTLGQAMITQFHVSGSSKDVTPQESITIEFGKIEFKVNEKNAADNITGTPDSPSTAP